MSRTILQPDSPLLLPLSEFYARQGAALGEVDVVEPGDVPEPQRTLLVHHADMTSALERHHGRVIELRVLEARQVNGVLTREVILTAGPQGPCVEFGAITIHVSRFEKPVRALILEGRRPLGAILREQGVAHRSRPAAFIRLRSDPVMNAAMGLRGTNTVYGRCNVLHGPSDEVIAEVVEILPPP